MTCIIYCINIVKVVDFIFDICKLISIMYDNKKNNFIYVKNNVLEKQLTQIQLS